MSIDNFFERVSECRKVLNFEKPLKLLISNNFYRSFQILSTIFFIRILILQFLFYFIIEYLRYMLNFMFLAEYFVDFIVWDNEIPRNLKDGTNNSADTIIIDET